MTKLFLLIALPLLSWASYLETCYKIFFLFLPVAESCVEYNSEGEKLIVKAWVKTVVIGSIVKRVNNKGEAHLRKLKPEEFLLFQREGRYIRDHRYLFGNSGVKYRIVRYKGKTRNIKEGFFKSRETLYDPFSASVFIYIHTPNKKGGTLTLFYDEKTRKVDYRTVGEEEVEVFGKLYKTWKVLFNPEMETKGFLKPKGTWYAWIDKNTNIPVRLKVSFTIGSAYVYLISVKGDKFLLRKIRNESI